MVLGQQIKRTPRRILRRMSREGRVMQRISYARPLRTLRETRDGLKQQQGRIKQEIARLDRIIRQLEAMSGDVADAPPAEVIETMAPPDRKGLSHAQAAGAVLAKAAAPLSIRQL